MRKLVGRFLINKGVLVILVVSREDDMVDVVVVIDTAVTPVCTAGVLLLMKGCFLTQLWFFILKYIHNKSGEDCKRGMTSQDVS